MPKMFVEENLRFTFDDEWSVIKLDEDPFFRKRLMPLQLTRAVDFLGLYRDSALYFIEVKDYRGSAIELKNDEKMCAGDRLFHQIGRKSKDSVACVAGAARLLRDEFWGKCTDLLRRPHSVVKVVFWLEFDLGLRGHKRNPNWIEQELRTQATNRENLLKAHLNWLKGEVVVANQSIGRGALPGVVVENVARAGNR